MKEKLNQNFTNSSQFRTDNEKSLSGPNGWMLFVACNSGIELAANIKNEYEQLLKDNEGIDVSIPLIGTKEEPITRVFSDTETCSRLQMHVAGANVYVFQSVQENLTGNTVNENIQQLIQVVRTLRVHRAQTITVVLPYSPYSRQDKPSFMKREAALAALFADQLKIAKADLCLTYHPHTSALYGFYEPDIKIVALSGLELFENIFRELVGRQDVTIVSTDAGGAKATVHFADRMKVSYAISSKYRKGKDKSNMIGVVGDLQNKTKAIIVDDETVTGGSIINTIKALHKFHGIEEIYVAVTHFKITKEFIGAFVEANEKHGLKELHITDTIPQKEEFLKLDFIHQHSIAPVFAATINKLHYNQSVSTIFSKV